MKNKTSSIAIAILSLSSFASNKASSETTENNALSAKAHAASQGADKVTTCVGTEPFWGLKIARDKIYFEDAGAEKKMTIANNGAKAAMGSLVEYISLYQGRTLENESQFLNVIIKNAKCSDGMSDTIYPFTVSVLSGATLYHGCCR